MPNTELLVQSCHNNRNFDVIGIINNNTDNNRRDNDRRDNDRNDNDRNDKFSDTKTNKNDIFDNDKKSKDLNVNIYRYKFEDDFTGELFKFSKIHQYDHRKDFKAAWENWLEENNDIVEDESRRLKNLGYDGDILDKMFKSARYYFRKKSTEKKAPAERRDYIGVHKNLLDAMDEHIKLEIKNADYKPSDGFDSFCKSNIDLLKEQINVLCKSGLTDSNEIKQKFKKTYKNRYFLLVKNNKG